ncbi:MAG: hypothetical protein K0S70_813 [Microbacterium sp.]|jgi:hypothetical protein|nr:hypothetical protein [Microbacterium sp.]
MSDVDMSAEALVWPTGEPVTVESIEGYTQDARSVAHPLDTRDVLTPDEVIRQLNEVSRWAERMVTVIKMAQAHMRLCSAERDEARAQAVLDVASHPAREHSARVTLATKNERRLYDAAVVAYEEARRAGNLLKEHSMRLQSIAKLVGLTYQQGGA